MSAAGGVTSNEPRAAPFPLGVTPAADGVNVAVVSRAERLELCLFDRHGRETARHLLPERTGDVWHGFVPGVAVGQAYGLRAHGPWEPKRGRRFNPAKLLLDPYARALTGAFRWEGPNLVDAADPLAVDPRDTAALVPKALVAPLPSPAPDIERPGVPWDMTVIYEAHVRGMTRLHPGVPEAARGRFAGLAHPAVIDHLVTLGITAVELLPVVAWIDELHLVRRGLVNYWGYNPLALFASEPRLGGADPAAEFRAMVAALHAAGLEVILDVVYNHTAEGDHLGPTVSFRGLDDALYYRQDAERPGRYLDWTGCGNALNLGEPHVVRLVTDSLRHWAALGVDGFRFDLGVALGRERQGGFRDDAPLLTAIRQDPVLGRLKLIMEPWDLGPDGYRAGGFPAPFAEWNDRFRDGVRRFWRGDEGVAPELAARLLGSADRFEHGGRRSWSTINYAASHDGFTTRDLVTYARKHNEANGEENRDGHGDELSASYGVEGETSDPATRATRRRQRRNLLATVLLAQGTPMLLMGDELGRSQRGNNNGYCQDNEASWLDWAPIEPDEEAFYDFIARLVALRRTHPTLRRPRYLHGQTFVSTGLPDAFWLGAAGGPMPVAAWRDPNLRCIGLLLGGAAGETTLLLLLNAGEEPVPFRLPSPGGIATFRVLLDTATPEGGGQRYAPGGEITLPERATLVLEGTS